MVNNLTTIKDRILQIAEIKKIAKDVLCQKIGMSYSSFKGDARNRPINSDALVNLLTVFPDLNPHWLLLGVGDIIKHESNYIGKTYGNYNTENSFGQVNIGNAKVQKFKYNQVNEGDSEYGRELKIVAEENVALKNKIVKLEAQLEILTSLLKK